MRAEFDFTGEKPAPVFLHIPRRLAHRGVVQLGLQHDAFAIHVKPAEPPGRAGPTRSRGRNELDVPLDLWRVQEAEPGRVERQETAGPSDAPTEVVRVERDAGLAAIAHPDG